MPGRVGVHSHAGAPKMRAGNNSAERQSKARRLRRKTSFLASPADAVDTTSFYRMAGRNLPVALALATFINNAGRCDPGQRAIATRAREISQLEGSTPSGKRDGFSPGRINAKIADDVPIDLRPSNLSAPVDHGNITAV